MPKPLAEIVIDEGLATQEQVVAAAHASDRTGRPLVVTLVRETGLDELALVSAIRRQMRVPLSDPGNVRLDPDALREVSRDACRRLRVLPLSVSVYDRGPRLLRLAMADPTDNVAILEVEHLTGTRVEVTLMPLSAVEEMVESGYRAFVTQVMKRGSTRSGRPRITTNDADDEDDATEPADGPAPTTMPFHRLSDEAHVALRHQALFDILLEKGVISEDEYEDRVRLLMKRRSDEG